MHKFLSIAVCIVLMTVGQALAGAPVDFSGTWTLDPAHSDMGMTMPPAMAAKMPQVTVVVTQTANQVTVERQRGEKAVYNLDGTPSINPLPGGGQSTTVLHWEGSVLKGKTVSTIQGKPMELLDERTLSADGKTMTVKVFHQNAGGPKTQTLIYTKK